MAELRAVAGKIPQVDSSAFLASGVRVVGEVHLAAEVNVWYNTVLRGDENWIRVGEGTNIQDNCTVHVMPDQPTEIGAGVTVGHGVTIHGCSIGDHCLIGMGATVLSYARIGDNCIIGAGSLITERKVIPPNSLVVGSPGRVVRSVTDAELAAIRESAIEYRHLADQHRSSTRVERGG